jgi:hypothetical protein
MEENESKTKIELKPNPAQAQAEPPQSVLSPIQMSTDDKIDFILHQLGIFQDRLNDLENDSSVGSSPPKTPSIKSSNSNIGFTTLAGPLKFPSRSSRKSSRRASIGKPPIASRKLSLLDRVADQISNPLNSIVMYQQQPSFDHIKLEKLNIPSVFRWTDAIDEYQTKYRINLPLSTMISTEVRESIISRNRNLDSANFHQITPLKLLKCLQKAARPNNIAEFQMALNKFVNFDIHPNYRPSASSFKPMHDALLKYRLTFEKIYNYMAEGNDANVPRCNNKDGGTIKIFISKIPFDYGIKIFATMSKNSYNDIDEFITEFYTTVQSHFKSSLKSRSLLSFFGEKYVSPDIRNRVEKSDVPARSHNVHQISDDLELESNIFETHQTPLDLEDESEEEAFLAVASEEDFIPEPKSPTPDIQNVTQTSRVDQKAPTACFQMLFYGECKRTPKCKYSHDFQTLKKAFENYSTLLEKQKSKYSGNQSHPAVLRRKTSLNEITMILNSPETQVDPDFPRLLHNMFLKQMPEASVIGTVYKSGTIVLPDKLLSVDKVLFDSGALHGSYMSRSFYQANFPYFAPYTESVELKAILADNKTQIVIDKVLKIPIEFEDMGQNIHKAEIIFSVFDTTKNNLIIGLPDILSCFGPLFIEMIDDGIKRLSDNGSHDIGTVVDKPDPVTHPWSKPIDQEAPEDDEAPIPCSFPYALHYMEITPEEAEKEYFSQLESHVSKEFADCTPILNLLKTKGLKVFVPHNWEGIKGVKPLELNWKPNLPPSIKPKARPVNPRLYENAKKEFDRLLKYFYAPSRSDIASCLVIAPKSTPPFIRFCGDYVFLNKYIEIGHYPIPHVLHELEKICGFEIFVDLDWMNSFHQFLLGEVTSERLSVQTPWGQVKPRFMPEGIGPASGILQATAAEIFNDFSDWTICIFDNLLVLAHDYKDAYRKVEMILDRCISRNVFFKFSKTWLGFKHANFFGYVCQKGKYELSQERKDSISAIPFPSSLKSMQSFLGAALFFKSFVPYYSDLTAPLNETVKKDFNWQDESTWKVDFRAIFERFKSELQKACALYYPDYSLEWILRTDASLVGVAAVLLMRKPNDDGTHILLPIGFASQKFSDPATRWSTIEQECYGCFFGIKTFSYYLYCKHFTLETDHNNLRWIEASSVPKVMRMRVFMQGFSFDLRHIPGKLNRIADFLSRNHSLTQESALQEILQLSMSILSPDISHVDENEDELVRVDSPKLTPDEALRTVHGGRMPHVGARRTYLELCKYYPGHSIPYRYVAEFVATCPICQKDRLGMSDSLKPVVRHLKPTHLRSTVGIDNLTISPPDKYGNNYCEVIINHYTKFTAIYPSKTRGALDAAKALFQYYCTFGVFDSIISDPGSEYMAEVVKHLHQWLGIRQVFSLVGRHESNGVERSNAEIIRHLKALTLDERIADRWSDPSVLPIVCFILNSTLSSETGVVPFHAHFGSQDETYFKLPESLTLPEATNEYVKLLNENLQLIRSISHEYQLKLIKERTEATPAELQNSYQTGDFVLLLRDPSKPLPSKLTPHFAGPYEVVSQFKNDVKCRSLIYGSIQDYHVQRLKLFHGTREQAVALARLDNDQYEILRFIAYRGDPLTRTTMEFEIEFIDGSISWELFSDDLFQTIQYEEFCRNHPPLFPLIYKAAEAAREVKELNAKPIESVAPGDTVFLDIRSFGHEWYATLDLPDLFHSTYVVSCFYQKWKSNAHRKIEVKCDIFDQEYVFDHFTVRSYGTVKIFDPSSMILVDKSFASKHPFILPEEKRETLLKRYRSS